MPIFMDKHNVPGVSALHVAEAHREDMQIQHHYGCKCMTYWVDEERENVFCLIEAPDAEAVRTLHNKAHGLIPHEIIEVNSNVVQAFLGRIQDPEGFYGEDPNLKIFNDPAFRTILVSRVTDRGLLAHQLGEDKAARLVGLYSEIMQKQLQAFEGREVELKGGGVTASFVSVNQAVDCAVAAIEELHVAGELLDLRIGINAGLPVNKSKELFGDTVRMARYLCRIGSENQIVLASIIREIYSGDKKGSSSSLFNWLDPNDENFLQTLMETIDANWQNHQFGLMDLCEQMSMSKSKVYRKTTALTNMSPNELIREYRLQKSLELLKTDRNITQTTYDSGFNSPSYFAKCFQERFGMVPHEYAKGI